MVLDNSGLELTLTCGTVLQFPINKSNNLPFMLTQTQLDKGRKLHNSSLNLKISTNSSGLYNSGVEVHTLPSGKCNKRVINTLYAHVFYD